MKNLLKYILGGLIFSLPLEFMGAQDPVDCTSAIAVCDSEQLNYNSNGAGIDDFTGPNSNSNGCLVSGEHQSAWFQLYISPSSLPNATLAFTLTPTGGAGQDYDFALYGPNVDCSDLGDPIRCSFAAGNCGFCPETGLGMGTVDFSEGVYGDGFVAEVQTQPGESYLLLIDNWSSSNQGFFLDWTGTAILSCACSTVAAITGELEICEGETTLLTATGTNLNGYLWAASGGGNISGPANTASVTATTPGTYMVTVSDADGCSGTASVEITEAPPPEIDFTVVPASCGLGNGSIDLTVTGGSTPYTYSWSNGSNTQDLTNLYEGAYSVTVTTSDGCTSSITIDVPEDSPLITISGIVNDNTSCTGGNGSITVVVNPAGMYTYEWSNGSTGSQISGLTSGTYELTVTSTGSCTATTTFTIIDEPDIPQITNNLSPSVCDLPNGEIDIQVSGGVSPYQFSWSNGETTEDLEDLLAGSYTVTVTASNGCSANITVIVTNNNPVIDIIPSITPNTNCIGQNGVITISLNPPVSPSGNPYTFLWSDGTSTQNITGLAPGTYTVTVDGGGSCIQTETFTIPDQPNYPVINSTIIAATCGDSNGAIITNVTGGTAPFDYLWSDGSLSPTLSGIPAGNYSVTVTGENGCSSVANFSVPDEGINFTVVENIQPNTSCSTDGNGSISITVVPGGNYTYVWSNGETGASIDQLNAGNYSLTVSAGGTCEQVLVFTVNDSPLLPVFNVEVTPSICNEPNGGASINVTGGEAPFTFLWSNGEITQSIQNVTSGNYTITVTGENSCTAVANINIPNQTIDISLTQSLTHNSSCTGGNGSIDLTVSPSSGLTFLWSNGENVPDIDELIAGSYSITISAGGTCEEIFDFTIQDNIILPVINLAAISATCGLENGSIDLSVSTGEAPFEYQWSNGDTYEDLSGIAAGSYTVTVTDALGCTNSATTTVNDNIISLEINGVVLPNTSCETPNGEINIDVSPSGTYQYDWSNGDNTQDLTGLEAGTYFVTVTSGDLCTATISFTVENQTSEPEVSANITGAICGESNGSINLTVTGSIPPYSFLWSTGENVEDITGLLPGNYYVTVTGSNDCSTTLSLNVPNNSSSFTMIGEAFPMTSCILNNGMIDLTIQPPGSYEFLWSNGETTEDILNLVPGEYSVTVTQSGSCSGSATFIIEDETSFPSFTTDINHDECNLSAGSIELLNITGTEPLTILWSNGENTASIYNLSSGTYTVTVTDYNGCSASYSQALVSNNIDISISGSSMPNTLCTSPNGSIDISLTPAGSYDYVWSNGSTSEDLNGLASGNYSVTVSYGSCVAAATFFVDADASAISLNGSATDVTCYGGNNGLINMDLAGGVPPYSITWIPDLPGSPEDPSGLSAGTYAVTVTDQAGCSTTAEFIIAQPELIVLNCYQNSSVSAPGELDGSGDIQITGGIPPYSITWTGGSQSGLQAGVFNIPGLGEGEYQVEVIDANGCIANCNFIINAEDCITSTGTMDPQPVMICGEGCVTALYDNTGEILNSGDILQFILHEGTGAQIQNEIARSSIPEFCFDPSLMQYSKQYFISAVAGADDGSGNVLLSGPCMHVSTGTPVIFYEVPQGLIDNPDQINCDNPEIELNGYSSIALSSFLWSTQNGNIISNPALSSITINKGGYYELIVSANSCSDTTGINVEQSDDFPNLTLGPVGNLTCRDISVILTGSALQPSVELQWATIMNNDTTIIGLGDSLIINSAGTYYFIGKASNGCASSIEFTVNDMINIPYVDAGADVTLVCDQPFHEITAISSADVEYLWIAPAGVGLPYDDSITLRIDQPGIYIVMVTDTLTYCTASDSIEVFQSQDVPVSQISIQDISCFGMADGTISVEPQQGISPYSFSINGQNQGMINQFNSLSSGYYTIEVTDEGGCKWIKDVVIHEPDPLTVNLGQDLSVQPGEMIELQLTTNVMPEQIENISWSPIPGFQCLTDLCTGITFSLNTSATVEVILTDTNGCAANDVISIMVLARNEVFAPNIFSPNGDGQNDVFTLFAGPGVRKIRHLSVYSRWGELLFTKENILPNDLTSGWDGMHRGQMVNPGIFVWRSEVEFQDGDARVLYGDVTLVR